MTAKEKADELFNAHYCEVLKRDTELSEEITVSLIAIDCAIVTCNESIRLVNSLKTMPLVVEFYEDVLKELEKM